LVLQNGCSALTGRAVDAAPEMAALSERENLNEDTLFPALQAQQEIRFQSLKPTAF
jgi:hypothetical protein